MLIEKHKEGEENGEIVPVEMRYKLADNVFGRATVNPGDGKVDAWSIIQASATVLTAEADR